MSSKHAAVLFRAHVGFQLECLEGRLLFDTTLYDVTYTTPAIQVSQATMNARGYPDSARASEGAFFSTGNGTNDTPLTQDGQTWGGAYTKPAVGEFKKLVYIPFHLTSAQITAITNSTGGSGVFKLTASEDIGLTQLEGGGFAPATDWVTAQSETGTVNLGDLFKNLESTMPFVAEGQPKPDGVGPNFHSDFKATDSSITLTREQFLSMIDANGDVKIDLGPSNGVGRVKFFAGELIFTVPDVVVADAGGPYTVYEGNSISLDGSGSTGTISSYEWDFDYDGVPADFNADATGVSPTFSASGLEEGVTRTIGLRVTGANQTTSIDTTTLDVLDAPLTPIPLGTDIHPIAGAPFGGKLGSFQDGNPEADASDFTITIDWGDGATTSGALVSQGNGLFDIVGKHTYAASGSYAYSIDVDDIGGSSTTVEGNADVSKLNLPVRSNQTQGIGFWHNKLGQSLIRLFNGGPRSTDLANWLAETFPKLYGKDAGSNDLSGRSNSDVAAFYLVQFGKKGPKVDAQVLATALNVYATTLSLGGLSGVFYGFGVSVTGLGARSFNIGSHGVGFGVPNNTTLNVYQMLIAANDAADSGVLYGGNKFLRAQANGAFDAVNSI
jgi:hypothetical protein